MCPYTSTCEEPCFPADATMSTADRGEVAMTHLRLGDRVLSVGWDGSMAYREIYAFGHRNAKLVASYYSVQVLGAGVDSKPRTLRLSANHHMAAGAAADGACAALAALAGSPSDASLSRAWTRSADHLSWTKDHVMVLPTALAPGHVAWVEGANGTAHPACVLSVTQTLAPGVFTPFVRARGIVVDGVVASPHTRWFIIAGWGLLPKAAYPYIPAFMEAALWPVYAAYKIAGPELAWRFNSLPLFEHWHFFYVIVGNAVVWGQACLLAMAVVGAIVAWRWQAKRSLKKGKAE